jgi:hypothetical protein
MSTSSASFSLLFITTVLALAFSVAEEKELSILHLEVVTWQWPTSQ